MTNRTMLGADATVDPPSFVFIDPGVSDFQDILNNLKPGEHVVVLDPARDALDQIAETLSTAHDVGAVHLFTEGSDGAIAFSSGALTLEGLAGHSADLHTIAEAMGPGAEMLLWGCDIGAGSTGAAFIEALAQAAGANVAASVDFTGAAPLGGNWTLEAQTAPIHVENPLTEAGIAAFDSVLSAQTAINNTQPVLGLTQFIDLSGDYPVLESDGQSSGGGFKLGFIRTFAGDFAPYDSAIAEGQTIALSSNPTLFSLLGTIYGGDGIHNFQLPDLVGKIEVGLGQGPGLSDYLVGEESGYSSTTLLRQNLPFSIGGSSLGFDDRQPSLAVTYLINTAGFFEGQSTTDFLGSVVAYAGYGGAERPTATFRPTGRC